MTYDPRKHGARCDICPRRTQTPVPPKGPKNRKVRWVWLGQDPGRTEVRKGEPFIGATGKRLDKIWGAVCARLGVTITRSEIWITNASLCEPITTSLKEGREAATCCRLRLLQEFKDHVEPDAGILAMGKWAAFGLWGIEKGVAGYTGFHKRFKLKRAWADAEEKLQKLIDKQSKGKKK